MPSSGRPVAGSRQSSQPEQGMDERGIERFLPGRAFGGSPSRRVFRFDRFIGLRGRRICAVLFLCLGGGEQKREHIAVVAVKGERGGECVAQRPVLRRGKEDEEQQGIFLFHTSSYAFPPAPCAGAAVWKEGRADGRNRLPLCIQWRMANDFKSFSSQKKELPKEWQEAASRASAALEGRGGEDILREILARAEAAKRAGTLSNAEIDAFAAQLAPALDAQGRRRLMKIAEKLKRL